MASSQNTFETRIGRFQDVVGILQIFAEYQPTNTLITKANLVTYLNDTLSKNTEVIDQDTILKANRDARRTLAFKEGDSNPASVHACLDNIGNYVAGELGTNHPAYKQIYSLKKKITPTYTKKTVTSTTDKPKTTRSTSEKSFTGLVGIAKQVIQIITSLGTAYAPQNPAIQLAAFTQKVNELDNLNQSIALALQKYSNAVQQRKELYDGTGGMKERTAMIRNYMASFSGGKKNPQYTQVMKALKGS